MEIGALKRDAAKAEAGQWISDIPGMEDLRLRVRGLSSKIVVALRSRKERKVSKNGRNSDGSLKPEVAVRILGEVLHEAVLLEWDGLKEDGKPIPYDSDLAGKWLLDPDFEPFADAVVYAARVVDNGRAETDENVSGNSKRSSAGSLSGASAPKN